MGSPMRACIIVSWKGSPGVVELTWNNHSNPVPGAVKVRAKPKAVVHVFLCVLATFADLLQVTICKVLKSPSVGCNSSMPDLPEKAVDLGRSEWESGLSPDGLLWWAPIGIVLPFLHVCVLSASLLVQQPSKNSSVHIKDCFPIFPFVMFSNGNVVF